MHQYAMKAAIAAMAAGKQGKFWAFHDRLFREHDKLSDKEINDIAKSIGLNMVEFEKQMKNPEIKFQIEKDILDGRHADVTGTPTIFINGRRLREWSQNGIQMLIDKELNKLRQKNK